MMGRVMAGSFRVLFKGNNGKSCEILQMKDMRFEKWDGAIFGGKVSK